jgi:5-methylcytosine-specific restriction protein A
MGATEDFHEAMLQVYRRAADEVGYRGTRFLQSVKRNGGLATAKRMLKPRNKAQRVGLDRLLEARKPELTMEYQVLQPKFRRLFTTDEREEAAKRLGRFRAAVVKLGKKRDQLYPDDLQPGRTYTEGAKRQIRVNAYERDPRARRACLAHHGTRCAACDISFSEKYGLLGKGFIHVHHLRPLALKGMADRVDPVTDMVPVCPNCHAMMHRKDPPLSVSRLRSILKRKGETAAK